mgnify:CR=1 FL=1
MDEYQVVVTKTARRDLRALPSEILERVDRVVLSLQGTPRPRSAIKLHGFRQRYRLRIGTYRVIYDVYDDLNKVVVIHIQHRRESYR